MKGLTIHAVAPTRICDVGGDGGSVAILCSGNLVKKRELEKCLLEKGYQSLPVLLAPEGLRVWTVS